MQNSNKDNGWPHQKFHDANKSENEDSRNSQVQWSGTQYEQHGAMQHKEGTGVLRSPGSEIHEIKTLANGTVKTDNYNRY